AFQISKEGILGSLSGNVCLQQLVFQVFEEGSLVWEQRDIDPVLRVSEDHPVGFPYSVAPHPLPPLDSLPVNGDVGDLTVISVFFQVHQAALNEKLNRANGLLDPGGHLARTHFDVDQEVIKKFLAVSKGLTIQNVRVADEK